MKFKHILKRVMMLSGIVALSFFSEVGTRLHGQSRHDYKYNQDTTVSFRYPLTVPMSLSGNYGELRSNHFHSGIDFRVGGVVGAPIYAAAQGYISRITVGPSGYGNALYITHPNGYMTVYGHMHCFADEIAEFVRERQYEQESFRQDIALSPEQFPVEKGQYIGKAGNTGSSGGPHLHFEIRDGENLCTNAFARGYLDIPDKTPPIFNNILFYGLEHNKGIPESYYIGMPKNGAINLPEHSYICIDAVDKQEGTNAKLAVNEYKVYLDDDLIYHFTLGEVPSAWGRDINSLIEFKQKVVRGRTYVKSYVEPGNLLQDRIQHKNYGVITLQDTLKHKVKVEVKDIEHNRAVRSYTVKRVDSLYIGKIQDTLKENAAIWFLPNLYSRKGFKLGMPLGVLYNNIFMHIDTLEQRVTPFAPVWNAGSSRVALRSAVSVGVECNLPDSIVSKAFLAYVYAGGKLGYAGGKYDPQSRMMSADVLSLGSFTVAVDMVPPQITSTLANNAAVKGNSLVFRIRDNLSGVKGYRVEIDGHWVLAEHDAKTRRVIVPLQHARIKKGTKHSLVFELEDNCGNVARVKRNFVW